MTAHNYTTCSRLSNRPSITSTEISTSRALTKMMMSNIKRIPGDDQVEVKMREKSIVDN